MGCWSAALWAGVWNRVRLTLNARVATAEGKVVTWLKSTGDKVKKGEVRNGDGRMCKGCKALPAPRSLAGSPAAPERMQTAEKDPKQ